MFYEGNLCCGFLSTLPRVNALLVIYNLSLPLHRVPLKRPIAPFSRLNLSSYKHVEWSTQEFISFAVVFFSKTL